MNPIGAEEEQAAEGADQNEKVGHFRVFPDQRRAQDVIDRSDDGGAPGEEQRRR